MKSTGKIALKIAGVGIITYLASYCARNLLSVSTPEMIKLGVFGEEKIGMLASVYMFVYAVGQLINGIIGDIAKPKIMVLTGLLLSGISNIVFAFTNSYPAAILCFAVMGFGLSMLRGPIVKVICENTEEKYARIACVLLSAVAFVGPLISGAFAALSGYKLNFIIIGIISMITAVIYCILNSYYEKTGIIKPIIKEKKEKLDILGIFKLPNFVLFMIVGMITEILLTSVAFWIPAYMSERLNFSISQSSTIFVIINVFRASAPFICLGFLKLFNNNEITTIRVMFFTGAAFCLLLNLILLPIANVISFLLLMFFISCASSIVWSVYIPSLSSSGKVSGVNGILDFSGYFAAAAANTLFSKLLLKLNWNGLVFLWLGILIFGVLVTFFAKNKKIAEK